MHASKPALLLAASFGLMLVTAPPAGAQGTTYTSIEQGRYLVAAGDCAFCHTDPGGKPYAGGRAIATPFGTIYSTNITPDPQTGIGKWSDADFYQSMHDGIRRDGEYLYPACPYPWFTKVTRTDMRAIKGFLDTLEPVRRENTPAELPWPLDVRAVMLGWNKLYFHEGTFEANPNKSDQWNRGAYLVEGLGHCGACHTAKNIAGAPKTDEKLQGGAFGEHWYAPSLTGDVRQGIGDWSADEIVEYLKTGANGKSAAAGPMADVVQNSTQYLTDSDLHAIAAYLRDVPAEAGTNRIAKADIDREALSRGEALYFDNCTGCHREDGSGIAGVFPPLKGSSAVQAELPHTVTHVILAGAAKPPTADKPAGLEMPAFDWKLDDRQVADLVNYVRNAWGNHAPATNADAVAAVRKDVKFGVE